MTVTEITNKTHVCRLTRECLVCIPAHLSHTGKKRWAMKPVDSCMADVIDAFNDIGMLTSSCCCGHGVAPGSIMFHNGLVFEISRCEVDHASGND